MKTNPSLRASKRILKEAKAALKKMKGKLPSKIEEEITLTIKNLETAIKAENKEKAVLFGIHLKCQLKESVYSMSYKTKELLKALVFALAVAFLVRQFWFELYEVPTGSMRPTIREQDRIIVSKTTFGIRLPFKSKPLLFSENNIQRGSLVIFTVRGMNVPDSDTRYFGIFPGKKRYVKRCIAKSGDTVYFYGGRVYIVDRNDNIITDQSDIAYLQQYGIENIRHVPFISCDGNVAFQSRTALFKQMNTPFGKLLVMNSSPKGFFFLNDHWNQDSPNSMKTPHNKPVSYAELMGMNNFSSVQILSPDQVPITHKQHDPNFSPINYLQMDYAANLTYPRPLLIRNSYDPLPILTPYTTYIGLTEDHIEKLRKNLTTARFNVLKGKAFRYHPQKTPLNSQIMTNAISMPKISDGCYEFENGIPYQIHFGGFRTILTSNHPLTSLNSKEIIQLFNVGINFNKQHENNRIYHSLLPQRFAFYDKGTLYAMDTPLFLKDDPELQRFQKNEQQKQEDSSSTYPYIGFIDIFRQLDPKISPKDILNFVKNFGFKIPEDHILVLGDNYPMSADSRDFGCVPVENLMGAPFYRFWPLGSSFGRLKQVPYPTNRITLVIISIVTLAALFYFTKKRLTKNK